MKAKILKLIEDKPKHYSVMIKRDASLNQWVLDNTLIKSEKFNDLIYSAVYNDNFICKNGKLRKLKRWADGLIGCGPANKCQCTRESISANVSKTKQTFTHEENNVINKKREDTMLEKYGVLFNTQRKEVVANAIERSRKENGVDYFFQTSEFKVLAKETNNTKYGADFNSQTSSGKEKARATCQTRFGANSFPETTEYREKTKAANQKKFGVNSGRQKHYKIKTKNILLNKDNFVEFATGKHIALIAYKLKIDSTTVVSYIKKYNCKEVIVPFSRSKWEIIIAEYLDELGINYVVNTREIISPLELDFYLPDHNIAIELNGNYWHSELAGGKDKKYHYNKWAECLKKGVDLYSYFEDELNTKMDIIKAKLRYISNKNTKVIGARKCTIGQTSYQEESGFLSNNHLQGPSSARSKVICAYYNEQLVAVMGWQLKKKYLEITRFACNTEASYPGLFSKLMKHIIKELNYTGDVVSFSNNGHSNGGVYKAAGFELDKILGPAYWYTDDYIIRENRQGYMKKDIAKKFNMDMAGKTEWQAMQELGYDRIWDCGKIKWKLTV